MRIQTRNASFGIGAEDKFCYMCGHETGKKHTGFYDPITGEKEIMPFCVNTECHISPDFSPRIIKTDSEYHERDTLNVTGIIIQVVLVLIILGILALIGFFIYDSVFGNL